MAAVYAALVSLFNNLEDIQNHHRHSFTFDNNQIQSLRGSVTFLIEFMESYDNCYGPSKEAVQLLERRITRAAHAAEEVIESHVVNQIRSGSTLDGKTRSPRFLLDLEKVTGDMDYVRRKAIKVQQARSGLEVRQPTYSTSASSSTPFTSEKTTMVGFDDLLLQLLDLLTGYPSSRRVIPIVGTGGVGHLGKSSRRQECWENVAKNMKSILNSEENKEFLDILSFSYNHLPIHLKPCFVYMGTFPEGKHIFVRDLIGHWIAEGFLKRCKTADNIEDIAKEYLKDLIDRNLILDGTSIQGRAICRERRVGIKEKNSEDNHHPEIVDAPSS